MYGRYLTAKSDLNHSKPLSGCAFLPGSGSFSIKLRPLYAYLLPISINTGKVQKLVFCSMAGIASIYKTKG